MDTPDSATEAPRSPSHALAAPAPGRIAGERRAIERRHALLLILPAMSFWLVTQISSAFLPWLATENTSLLISLSTSNRNLVIAAASAKGWLDAGNAAPAVLFVIIGMARLMAPDPFFYGIGRRYGDRAIEWLERRTPSFGEMMREFETLYAKASWFFVLTVPNIPVCLLAGASRMPLRRFWTLNVIGTAGRVALFWFVGQALQEWIDRALGFVEEHRTPFLVATIVLVGLTMMREWRSGTTQAQSLLELEHQIEEDVDAGLATADSPAGGAAGPAAAAGDGPDLDGSTAGDARPAP